jgi:hypothetical protein
MFIDVNVSLDDGIAIVYGNPSFDEINKALSEEGYPSKMIEENSSCNDYKVPLKPPYIILAP